MKNTILIKFKKSIFCTCVSTLLLFSCLSPVYAQSLSTLPNESSQENSQATPRADQFVYRFRKMKDGSIERRLWNLTKGEWAEPSWTKVA